MHQASDSKTFTSANGSPEDARIGSAPVSPIQQTRGSSTFGFLAGSAVSMILTGAVYGTIMFAMVHHSRSKVGAAAMVQTEAKGAARQIEKDIHSAISEPELVDAGRGTVAGGPAAGIAFKVFSGGPFIVTASSDGNKPTITADFGRFIPTAGQHFAIPSHGIEIEIADVSSELGPRTVTLTKPLPAATLAALKAADAQKLQTFVTDRVAYVVTGGELRYYGRKDSENYSVMAHAIAARRPFTLPQTADGTPSRFVAAINLSTIDPSADARSGQAANLFISSSVPTGTRLGIYD